MSDVKVPNGKAPLAEIPDPEEFARYIPRQFEGLPYHEVFDIAALLHYNVLIEGPTGSGKTSAIRAWCAKQKKRFYSVSSTNGVEPSQLFGRYVPNDGDDAATRPVIWQDGPVTDLVRHGGVLLINEVNFLSQRVASALFSLLDFRRQIQLPEHHGEVIDAHDELVIFVDMNPGYAGTIELNAAFRNRFQIQLDWDYDEEVERRLVPVAPLLELMDSLRNRIKSGDLEAAMGTNVLIEFDKIARMSTAGYNFAVYNLINHFVEPVHRQSVKNSFQQYDSIRDYYKLEAQRQAALERGEKDPYDGWVLGDADDLIKSDTDFDVDETDFEYIEEQSA